MPTVILYSTSCCPLCDQARTMLIQSGPGLEFEEVDIGDDDALLSRYGERIPVLLKTETGEELAWPFDAQGLVRFMG